MSLIGGGWKDKLLKIMDEYTRDGIISRPSYKYIYTRVEELSTKLSELSKDHTSRKSYQEKYDTFLGFLQKIIDDDKVPKEWTGSLKPAPKPAPKTAPKPAPTSAPKPAPTSAPTSAPKTSKKMPSSNKYTRKLYKTQFITKLDDSNILKHGHIVNIPYTSNSALQSFIYGVIHFYQTNATLFDNPTTQKYIHDPKYSPHIISFIEWIKSISSHELPLNAVNYSNSNEFNGYQNIFLILRIIINLYYEGHVKMDLVLNQANPFTFDVDELIILGEIFDVCIVVIDVPTFKLSVDSITCENVLFVIKHIVKNLIHFMPYIHRKSIFIEEKKKNMKELSNKELGNKEKEYYFQCQREREKLEYITNQYERDVKQISRITQKCNYENIEIEFKSKFNVPSFKSMHPTLYDMKSDIKTSTEMLTSRLDKIYSYNGIVNIGNILFYNLLYKYRSKCFVTPINEPNLIPPTFEKFDTKLLLGLYIDPTDTFKKVFPEDYIKYLGNKLLSCVSKSNDIILIHLIIFSKTEYAGHSNMLIYKPEEKNIYRFEPYGSTYIYKEQDNTINQYLKTLFEKELSVYIQGINYLTPLHICPMGDKGMPELEGLQSFEIKYGKKEVKEGLGYCMMWSLLFAEMVLLNPTKPLIEIMNELFLITNKDPKQLRNIIRGYVKLSTDILKEIFNVLLNEKIESYDDLMYYLKFTKDTKYTLIMRLLLLFTQEKRPNSKNAGKRHTRYKYRKAI